MRKYFYSIVVVILILSLSVGLTAGKVRVKDISRFQLENTVPLFGYGLVVGLDGTGDSKSTRFTIQSLVNMMERMGVTVDPGQVKVKNVAAVMVTVELTPYMSSGSRVDVMVSSMGDATSLQGGTLLYTPLADASGDVYAVSQGPISIGGFNISTGMGDQFRNNYTLVGRIPDGATVEKQIAGDENIGAVKLHLEIPDFTTANRLANAINNKFKYVKAYASDEANIEITIPDSLKNSGELVRFFAEVEKLEIEPDVPARVAINEKTGTIAAGQNVTISAVMLAHGSLNIEIKATPLVSQPEPFSQGKTVLTREAEINVEAEPARILYIENQANIGNLAAALNEIGATPRDIIAIFQALKAIGALRAELVIL
ncbi:MAG: flagellar basal body P-ring protein FlgI [candidate division Zixibacteria bacterium]|nr:flagellar basal body P-ring protein FlgI [candidate division Zixibacteria bacterium]